MAEESGLIVPLGRWAIEEATQTLAAWDVRAGGDCGVQVTVNLSPLQLQRDSIVTLVSQALAASGLNGERLKLELTESALVADPDRTAATMHALKDLGVTIAMDDFGTGYSNLAYLQKLPIDLLKIDRSFVTGMLADRDKLAIVRAILSLAQALNMRTVAEGIESNELAQTLAALGCTYGQGYLYARPLGGERCLCADRAALRRARLIHDLVGDRRASRASPGKPSSIQRRSIALQQPGDGRSGGDAAGDHVAAGQRQAGGLPGRKVA